jgi:hypothetical protein
LLPQSKIAVFTVCFALLMLEMWLPVLLVLFLSHPTGRLRKLHEASCENWRALFTVVRPAADA